MRAASSSEQTSGVTASSSAPVVANGVAGTVVASTVVANSVVSSSTVVGTTPRLLKHNSVDEYSQQVIAQLNGKESEEKVAAAPQSQAVSVPAVSYTPFDQAPSNNQVGVAPAIVRYGQWGIPIFRPNVYIEALRNTQQLAMAKAGKVVAVAKQIHDNLDAWVKAAPDKVPPPALQCTRELMQAYEKIWTDPLALLLQPKVIKAEAARVAIRSCIKSVCIYNHADSCEQTCYECSKLAQLRSLVSTLINDHMAQVQVPAHAVDQLNKENPIVGVLLGSVTLMWQEYCQTYPQYGINFSILFDELM